MDKFEQLLAERREKELKTTLNKIAQALNNDDGDRVIAQAINEQSTSMNKMTEVLKQISKNPEESAMNTVMAKQDQIITELAKLNKYVSIKHRWEFTLEENHFGEIKRVIAEQTR